jgi:hypothetical protein
VIEAWVQGQPCDTAAMIVPGRFFPQFFPSFALMRDENWADRGQRKRRRQILAIVSIAPVAIDAHRHGPILTVAR